MTWRTGILSLVTRLLPDSAVEWLADRSLSWWAMTAVLPDPDNRITVQGNRINVNYTANNREAHDRLAYRWLDTIQRVEADPLTQVVRQAPIYPRGEAPLSVMGLAYGTCRMCSDPVGSVVNLEGRCHQIANLWIADASTLPGCPAVGPGLTVIANALRIATQRRAGLRAARGPHRQKRGHQLMQESMHRRAGFTDANHRHPR